MSYDPLDELRTALADRYRLIAEAGRGGMATVYRAEDLKHRREVAIKVLSPELSSTIGEDRFSREIHIAARLQHPHILPVHDSGEAGRRLYYVMPFVEGESLRARLRRESQLPLEDAVAITLEIAGALGYAHSRGVVHRDIKPENVLLEQGHAVLADFGIALATADSGEKLTQTGTSVGTATYMSPEQFAGAEVDARSDVYSLGCMLYEMLVGEVPFTGPSMMAIMARHTMEQVPSIRVVRPSVPDEVEDAVYRALEKVPADRFQSMDEFRRALTGGATGTWTRTRGHTARFRTPVLPQPAVPAVPWRRPVTLLLAALMVLGGGAAAVVWSTLPASPAVSVDANKLAVLYFDDASGDSLRYLGDALTESLIEQLADVGGLTVVSRAGVEPFRDRRVTPDTVARIAARLGVGTIVRGSVEPDGDGVQVSVRLADASGAEVDRATFRMPSRDLVALRDSAAEQVAFFLRDRVGREVTLRERRARARDATAWVLAQRAERRRKDAERMQAADSAVQALAALDAADSLLRAAEGLDGRWPDAPAMRARVAQTRARMLRAAPAAARAAIDSGIVHAERAMALDPRLAEAWEARGTLRYQRVVRRYVEGDAARALLDSAEQDLLTAVRWRPTQATAWATLSSLYYRKPDVAEAKNAAVNAYNADAWLTAADQILMRLFWTNYDQELFAEAQRWCLEGIRRFAEQQFFHECQLWLQTAPKGIAIDPDRAWALRDSLVARGARSAADAAFDAAKGSILVAGSLGRAGLVDSARRVLDRVRATRTPDPARELAANEAVVRVILGDHDEAVKLIKEYLSVHPDHRRGFASGTGWWWRDLQAHPEFQRMVQAVR